MLTCECSETLCVGHGFWWITDYTGVAWLSYCSAEFNSPKRCTRLMSSATLRSVRSVNTITANAHLIRVLGKNSSPLCPWKTLIPEGKREDIGSAAAAYMRSGQKPTPDDSVRVVVSPQEGHQRGGVGEALPYESHKITSLYLCQPYATDFRPQLCALTLNRKNYTKPWRHNHTFLYPCWRYAARMEFQLPAIYPLRIEQLEGCHGTNKSTRAFCLYAQWAIIVQM